MKNYLRGFESARRWVAIGLMLIVSYPGLNFTDNGSGICLADPILTGSLEGEWDPSEGTYLLYGEVYVEMGNTLVINPGVQVKFADDIDFSIYGTLTANGTEEDSIRFTSSQVFPIIGDWGRIKFLGTTSSNSILQYCIVEWAVQGIRLESSSPSIVHCSIRNNAEQGIYALNTFMTLDSSAISNNGLSTLSGSGMVIVGGAPHLRGNEISCNGHDGIVCSGISGGEISGNNIHNNSEVGLNLDEDCNSVEIFGNYLSYNGVHGMYIYQCGTAGNPLDIHHNVIFRNEYNAIYSYTSYPKIYNNTLTNNLRDGIFCYSGSVVLYSNIIDNNEERGIYIQNASATINYNDVWNNYEDYKDCNPGASDISADPLYEYAGEDNYQISEGSPCIDAGNPSSLYYDPDNTRTDIGALYYNQLSVGPQEPRLIPVNSIVLSNYPNPFNSETIIKIEFSALTGEVNSLDIYNSIGRLVRTLDITNSSISEITWDGKDNRGFDLSTGVYYASTEGSNIVRMILLR
ncbi:MAG: right-handed parallel beta-helix repeat-containing protein [FCB group bacterium]|nr:right-handed parallel beta-helix repeat-containing protein [FCB group bacterium]